MFKVNNKDTERRLVDSKQLFVHVDFEQLCRIAWHKKSSGLLSNWLKYLYLLLKKQQMSMT